jgi:hypothetical protein
VVLRKFASGALAAAPAEMIGEMPVSKIRIAIGLGGTFGRLKDYRRNATRYDRHLELKFISL